MNRLIPTLIAGAVLAASSLCTSAFAQDAAIRKNLA